jgi:predicted 3-demethylubiquinone-9 3-methyltransferase (glyoxalase superfamily)
MPFAGLNGGPNFKFNEAISFQVHTDSQEETDRYWDAIVGKDGQESQYGWCKDKFGLSWQITPPARFSTPSPIPIRRRRSVPWTQ